MGQLYPELKPYLEGHLKVSERHEIHYEVSGNPDGQPVIFLHGGPGGGSQDSYRRYFNPQKYKIILFDQRGCGKSRPFSELRENTTWDLVADMEKIRAYLEIKKWAVFGGSWGSTLALAYAETHPEACQALFLRGIFLIRKKEIDWFYQEGASKLYPDAFSLYLKPIPEEERHDLLKAYHQRLTHEDDKIRSEAAKAWSTWEGSTSRLLPDLEMAAKYGSDEFADAFARIECHYFTNKGFFTSDNYLIENVDKIRHIPAWIVHGRYDVVCPLENAWELHQAWPEANFQIIEAAGHSLAEEGITRALIDATDSWVS